MLILADLVSLRILVGRFFKLRRRNTRGIPSAPTLIPEAESLDDSAIVDHAIETTVACAIETTGAMDLKGSDTVVDPDSKCFDDLPEDVILAIIFHVDERTLWIIMQLSHSIAQKAKTAVIPYLRERVIVGQPKMFTSSKLDPLSLNVYMGTCVPKSKEGYWLTLCSTSTCQPRFFSPCNQPTK